MKRILIVEDEAIIRMDLKVMLETEGYEVIEEANDGEKAIEHALTLKPDLILMDIKMPKLDGLKASKIIGQKLDTPIIIITAYSQKEFIKRAQQDNIVGYLVKPISEKNLFPAIEIAFHQAAKAQELVNEVMEAKSTVEARKLIETAKGIMMEKGNLSEAEAFKRLRHKSMTERIPMHKLATEIIKKYKS